MSEMHGVNKAGGENEALARAWGVGSDTSNGYDERRLADAFYRLSHGDGGRSLMRPQTLELALAAGLLGELVVTRKIALWDGDEGGAPDRVAVFDAQPPDDPVSAFVYTEMLSDAYQDLATWLQALRQVSTEKVMTRMGLAPVKVRRGLFGGRSPAPPPAPTGREADRAWAALTLRIRRLTPLSEADALLIGCGFATGIHAHLLEGALPPARRHAEDAVATLADLPAQLVAQLEAAVAKDSLRPHG